MPAERMPTSQAARAARVGRLAATEAVRHAGTRAANITRPRPARRAALERRHLETADQILTVLGTMKGAAMKLGQMLSFVDLGVVPRHARPEFHRKLAALRDAAPQVSFGRMMRVLDEELGRPRSAVFRAFDEEPIGVASIGQVYRATLTDGRRVAVKVQYPGIAAAVRADMKNLALLMRLVRRALPGVDTDSLSREIRMRVGEELDYKLEARNQHAFAQAFRGHPFVIVPDAIEELSGARVLVSEYVEGTGSSSSRLRPPPFVTEPARSSTVSFAARFTGGTSSREIPIRATSCSRTTGGSRSLTSDCSSAWMARASSSSWLASAPRPRGARTTSIV